MTRRSVHAGGEAVGLHLANAFIGASGLLRVCVTCDMVFRVWLFRCCAEGCPVLARFGRWLSCCGVFLFALVPLYVESSRRMFLFALVPLYVVSSRVPV